MKPGQSETKELLKKLAKSATWWRRFFESNDAEEIHQIISELSPLDLATLDQRVRESWTAYRYYQLQNWQSLRASDVGRLAQSKFATSLVGLASFHFSGYVREAAVAELKSKTRRSFMPMRLETETGAPPGRGCYWDAHELRHESTGTVLAFPEWEWADFVDGRLIFASEGRLCVARLRSGTFINAKVLHDFNGMKFEAIAAPY